MRKVIGKIFILAGISMFIFIFVMIINQHNLYKEGIETYNKIAEDATDNGDSNAPPEEFYVDWEALGSNVYAWIKFDKPDIINYPVVRGSDNSYYLHHMYNGEYSINGSIFINSANNPYMRDDNTIIYGHNMDNGTMFGSISEYKDSSFGMENPYFYIYLPDGTMHKYQIFSVVDAQDGTADYTYQFSNEEEYINYQKLMKGKGLYETSLKIDGSKKLVSLSTCSEWGSSSGHRVMVIGMEMNVEQIQQPASWYINPETTKTESQTESKKKEELVYENQDNAVE